MRQFLLIVLVGVSAFASSAAAEAIYLKSGKKVEAQITERTDKYVTVDWLGVSVTYWMDEIERIDAAGAASQPTIAGAPAPATAVPPEQRALVAEVLQLAGAKVQLQHMQDTVPEQLNQPDRQARLAKMPPEIRERFERIMLNAFSVDLLYPMMEQAVADHFDEARLKAAATWLRTPVAIKMVALESRAPTPQEMEAFGQRLEQRMPSEERVALLAQLEQALHGSDLMLDLMMAMMAGISQGALAAGDMTSAEADQEMQRVRQTLAGQYGDLFKDAMLVQMLWTYESASMDELRQYAAWWQTEDGRWFSQTVYEALHHTLGQASARMASDLLQVLKSAKPAAPA